MTVKEAVIELAKAVGRQDIVDALSEEKQEEHPTTSTLGGKH